MSAHRLGRERTSGASLRQPRHGKARKAGRGRHSGQLAAGDPAATLRSTMAFSLYLETLEQPWRYTTDQLERAKRVAEQLRRGRFVLCEAPDR